MVIVRMSKKTNQVAQASIITRLFLSLDGRDVSEGELYFGSPHLHPLPQMGEEITLIYATKY